MALLRAEGLARRSEDLRAARGCDYVALRVERLGGAEDDSLRPMDDTALRPPRPRSGRAEELDSQIDGEERLALLEQAPTGATHRRVEDCRDEAAVEDRARLGRGAGLLGRVPLDHRLAVLWRLAPVAERPPDVRAVGPLLSPRAALAHSRDLTAPSGMSCSRPQASQSSALRAPNAVVSPS